MICSQCGKNVKFAVPWNIFHVNTVFKKLLFVYRVQKLLCMTLLQNFQQLRYHSVKNANIYSHHIFAKMHVKSQNFCETMVRVNFRILHTVLVKLLWILHYSHAQLFSHSVKKGAYFPLKVPKFAYFREAIFFSQTTNC